MLCARFRPGRLSQAFASRVGVFYVSMHLFALASANAKVMPVYSLSYGYNPQELRLLVASTAILGELGSEMTSDVRGVFLIGIFLAIGAARICSCNSDVS